MGKLAINGGNPIRTKPFPEYRTIGDEEKDAACRVINSGILSRYLGCWHENYHGGTEVKAVEEEWCTYFGVKHAIVVNSCTSGLYCAVGAVGVEPCDEVIVSPFTMTASAVAPLIFNAIPIFTDIEPDYFCLDPDSIESVITERTKAIIVVDLFGYPYDAKRINDIAKKHGLYVIEDAAQAITAESPLGKAGTLGDIGVYSLNYHKHIHCGEGGVVVTNDNRLAERVRLIRNHAEAVVEDKGVSNIVNMIGYNFRMTEIEAAILRCQLKKLKDLQEVRLANCDYLAKKIGEVDMLIPPFVQNGFSHAFYAYPYKFDSGVAGVERNLFVDAIAAELPVTILRESEGPLIGNGYVTPLYLQPIYQRQIAYGSKGFPFTSSERKEKLNFAKGLCPVAERMHNVELFTHEFISPGMSRSDLDDVARAFHKVLENIEELKK